MSEREYDNPWEDPDNPWAPETPETPTTPTATRGPVSDQPGTPPVNRTDTPWYWDYNNGSAPGVPLGGGMTGWNWDGDRWWQPPTQAPDTPPDPPPPTDGPPPPTGGPAPTGSGAVPSLP